MNWDAAFSGTATISASATGLCGTTNANRIVTVNPSTGAVNFTAGATTVCQNAVDETYTATAANSTSIAYSVAPPTAGVINASTGVMNWNAAFSGTATITATATGLCTTTIANRLVTVNPSTGVVGFTAGATTVCQNAADETYTATAANSTSIAYSVSPLAAGTINTVTGLMNWDAAFTGTATITATATGLCGTTIASRTVTVIPTVTINPFATAASSRCQGAATINYNTTASNSTGIIYSLDNASILAGNTIVPSTGAVTYTAIWSGTTTITASAAGCNGPAVTTHVVTVAPEVTITAFAPAVSNRCQGAGTFTLTTTANNSTGITYSIDAASLAGLNTINSVTGEVTFAATWTGTTIITASAAGCNGPKTTTHTVSITQKPAATATTANVACYGASTGSVNLTVTGGTPGYIFTWSNGAITEDLSNVAAGTYTVNISDSKGCTASATATVTQPASGVTGTITSKTNATFGGYDGSVTIAGAGGVPSYKYKMGAGAYQTSGTFSSLGAGSYIVTVQDANLCTFNVPFTITQPLSGLKGTIVSQTNVTCFGSNTGSVTVAGLDGILPYQYKINSGSYQPSATFGSLTAGNYTVTIIDAVLTEAVVNVTITQPATGVGGSVVSQTNVLCYGSKNGSVTVNGSGGIAPYQYRLGTGALQSSGTFASLSAGSYAITIQDAINCVSVLTVNITQPLAVLAGNIASQTNISCNGAANGVVTVSGTGGTPPYQYSLNGGTYQSSGTFGGLAPATVTVSVRDANLCSTNVPVTITEPGVLSLSSTKTDASCPGVYDGSITLTITGGTQPYKALWSDGVTTINRTNITGGTYSVAIIDKNNCASSLSVEIAYNGSGKCIEVQEIITPNGDGFYDTWDIKNINLFGDAEVNVYNRWGKRVYSSKNFSANPWDGTSDGKLLPTDSYHYVIHFNNGSERKTGVVSIIR